MGDYTEHSLVYAVDPDTGQRRRAWRCWSSAYGAEPRGDDAMRQDFLDAVCPYVEAGRPVLFPVPRYGRGQEMLCLLSGKWPEIPVYGDTHFQKQVTALSRDHRWVRPQARDFLQKLEVHPLEERLPRTGFCWRPGACAFRRNRCSISGTASPMRRRPVTWRYAWPTWTPRFWEARRPLLEAAVCPEADTVVTAVVGMVGLRPTLAAIRERKRIALANKETLVCAGQLVMDAADTHGAEIVPVDSEHSAIFQCLQGCADRREIRRLILTCSGGPFYGMTYEEVGK